MVIAINNLEIVFLLFFILYVLFYYVFYGYKHKQVFGQISTILYQINNELNVINYKIIKN